MFGTFTHRKNRYDINARVTSATYYSQSSKRSHLQLVSWVAKTCTNMSRLVANTSHPVNKHYNSNPDTFWTNNVGLHPEKTRQFVPPIASQQTRCHAQIHDSVPLRCTVYSTAVNCHEEWLLINMCAPAVLCVCGASKNQLIVIERHHLSLCTLCNSSQPNPPVQRIRNYTLADLTNTYKKYKHKRPKHILL